MDFNKTILSQLTSQFSIAGELTVSRPPKENMGDFCISCFKLSVDSITVPVKIAQYIHENLNLPIGGLVKETKVIGPYVNFFLDRNVVIHSVIDEILIAKERYGSKGQGDDKQLLIEHTSINPNASPHIGRARNSIIGDFLSRLFTFVGYDVQRHYFINDIGKQISMLVYALDYLSIPLTEVTFQQMLDLYIKINEESTKHPEIEQKVFNQLELLENGDNVIRDKFKRITDICVEGQTKIFNRMGISFDVFTHESDFVFGDKINPILDCLKQKGRLKEDAIGRLYVDLSGYDIPTKEPVLVLTRENKTSLYPLRDIAYTVYKMKINPQHNFIVLGEDQEVYMQQISAVLDILGYPAPILTSYSFVLLKEGKMSTRLGRVVLLEEFIDAMMAELKDGFAKRGTIHDDKTIEQIASSCIKYNILNVHRKRNVVFDMSEATNVQGDSAVFILYNYARINSILNRCNFDVSSLPASDVQLDNDLEYSLVSDLSDFPDIIDSLLVSRESVTLIKYLYSLTQKFSRYYSAVPILLEVDEHVRQSRLILLYCLKTVMKTGMEIIGVTPMEKF